MLERVDGRLVVTAPLLMDTAQQLLLAGCAALEAGEQIIDLGRVEEADSSALAVMMGWMRAAQGSGSTLKFANIPAGVLSLAELYGVAELIPLA
jgi:phospholipid transport system transporter-binding protein